MARILSLVWYKVLPAKFGGQKGISGFSQHLGELHDLYMLCAANNEIQGNETYQVINSLPTGKWQFTDPAVYRLIERTVDQHQVSHLVLEHCYHGWHGVRIARKKKLKLIVHSHNIEYERFQEMGKWWWPLLRLLERWTHRSAELSLFKTEEDLQKAMDQFGLKKEKCMVVPFGIERAEIRSHEEQLKARNLLEKKHGIAPETRILLFNGTLDYEPNARALQQIVTRIIPELERLTDQPFIVIVTGRIFYKQYEYLKKLSHPRYIYAGLVDDVEPYFAGADIFINPVIEGGGIKVKLVEALSFGLPVISYQSGAIGIDPTITGSQLTVVGDGDVEEFAGAVLACWQHKANLPEVFFSRYAWNSIATGVAKRIEQL